MFDEIFILYVKSTDCYLDKKIKENNDDLATSLARERIEICIIFYAENLKGKTINEAL
jgi:hypothetical protein